MATRSTLAARTTGVLTGGGTPDYGADLDMNLTEDGWVTVEIVPTLDTLVSITLTMHCGPAATPVGIMTDGTAQISHDLAAHTGVMCSFSIKCCARYFRAAITGAGGAPGASDAIINYYYSPKASTHTTATQVTTNVDGMPQVAAGVISHA